jgi:hypothetical protein
MIHFVRIDLEQPFPQTPPIGDLDIQARAGIELED